MHSIKTKAQKMLRLSEEIRHTLWFQAQKFPEDTRKDLYEATDCIKRFLDNLPTRKELNKK